MDFKDYILYFSLKEEHSCNENRLVIVLDQDVYFL